MKLEAQDLVIGQRQWMAEFRVNAHWSPGGLHLLLGNNGVGKSSLLKTIAGLLTPKAGQVLLDNKSMVGRNRREYAAQFAYLTSRIALRNRITVQDFLRIGSGQKVNDLGLTQVLTAVGLGHKLNQWVTELSDGEIQKMQIALVLLRDSPVLLLDEPLSFLDPPSRLELMKLFYQMAETKIVLMTSHQTESIGSSVKSISAITAGGEFLFVEDQPQLEKDLEQRIYY